jgi:hypothetical protein
MPPLRLEWTQPSKSQFEAVCQRARAGGHYADLVAAHNHMVRTLQDLTEALSQGEALYPTRLPGGEVRLWIHGFLALTYVVFRAQEVGFIVQYQTLPDTWPF